jgi:hypothetical protein
MELFSAIRVVKIHTGDIMSIKVVYNACFGGFGLSKKAAERLAQLGVEDADKTLKDQESNPSVFGFHYSAYDLVRHDSRLVQVVEELGDEANGSFADLQVAEIPSNKYRIHEYDGNESVQTPEDIDWITVE